MSEHHLKAIDQMVGIAIVGVATIVFAVPFALILLSPLLGGM